MRTPIAMYYDWWLRWSDRRILDREAQDFARQTGHKDWGDDALGTTLAQSLTAYQSLNVMGLSALPPGVELVASEVKEAWRGVDTPDGITLNLLETLARVELVSMARGDDGWWRATVPEDLQERLASRWSVDKARAWHGRLLDNARELVKHGDNWWDLPADARYWWRHLVWHVWHTDREAATELVGHPRWQTARIQRFETQGLLTDLALVDSPESRATASTINEIISREDPSAPRDPAELAQDLLRALGLTAAAAPPVLWPRSAVRAVLRVPPFASAFALSPDGTWLVTGGRGNLIQVYDLATQTVRRTIHGSYDRTDHCAFSPDGSFILAGRVCERARTWDAVSGNPRSHVRLHNVTNSAQTPDGTWISYEKESGYLGDPLTGRRWSTHPRTAEMSSMALSADGETLAMGSTMGDVSLWDPRSGQLRAELPRQPHEIHRLGLAGDGSWIAIGGLYDILVLELPSGQERFRLQRDGTRCAVGEDWLAVPDKNRVQIRSIQDGALLSTLDVHKTSVLDCRLSPDAKHLMTLDNGGTLMVWDATTLVP
ncbi:WD40 repeat domain-containing protein [Streptomyces sp. FR-108]|uniref:WD40 repeat domain-containing protein n=1 Tax=Streptomyces sp. FR-108 TaxID=3416665 RepID=UPI003CF50EBC